MTPNRRWSCPELKAAFNAKTKAVRTSTGCQNLPLPAQLFRFLTLEDLYQFNGMLGNDARHGADEWAEIFGEVNKHIIESKKITVTRGIVEFVQCKLDPATASKFLILVAYYRLAEMDTIKFIDCHVELKSKTKTRLKRAKHSARSISRNIPSLLKGLEDLNQFLEDFEGQKGFEDISMLRNACGRDWLKSIMELANYVKQINPDSEPELFRAVDRLLHPGQPDRKIDYSKTEKKALVALDQVLQNQGHSANSSAKIIATTWQRLGPLRDPWEYSCKHQALRRALTRWWRIQAVQCS